MAQLSRRWALLHSFGLFRLLFGLYDDGTWRQVADAYTKLCKHLQGWHKDTSKCSQQSKLCALMQQLPKICMELACIRQLLAHVYTCDLDFVIAACMAFLALSEILSNDWQLSMSVIHALQVSSGYRIQVGLGQAGPQPCQAGAH